MILVLDARRRNRISLWEEKVKKVFRSRRTKGIVLLATGITGQGSSLLFEGLTLDIKPELIQQIPYPNRAR